LDTDATSFEDWPFLSVHFWGERPEGMWTLEVLNMGQQPRYWADMAGQGELIKWQLLFYGTGEKPVLPIHA
jgi:subtilisin-like proprotein convertase family protein